MLKMKLIVGANIRSGRIDQVELVIPSQLKTNVESRFVVDFRFHQEVMRSSLGAED